MGLVAPEPKAQGGGTVTKAEPVFVVGSGTAGTVGMDSEDIHRPPIHPAV